MKRTIISIIITLSLMSVFSFGIIEFNWPCLLYDGQCLPKYSNQSSIQSVSPSLDQLSIDAAGFFLQSNSDFQSFLKKVELSETYGLNYEDSIDIISSSIENMEMANSLYFQVWVISKSLERNPVVLLKLNQFNYDLFQDENMFIPSIFNEVMRFLRPGNMTGAFEWIYNETGVIIKGLKSIKALLAANYIDIHGCWNVNQHLIKAALFGQYISQVFFEIKKSIM
jgi:hypothetical protein